MGSPVPLRDDFDAAVLRALARRTLDANQGRRLLALAAVYDGGSRGDAARIGSVGLQTVRDWVPRFNAAVSLLKTSYRTESLVFPPNAG